MPRLLRMLACCVQDCLAADLCHGAMLSEVRCAYTGDEDKVLLGSEKGDVMIVHNGDLRGSLSVEPEAAIRAIVPTSKVHHPAALAQLTVLRRTRVPGRHHNPSH